MGNLGKQPADATASKFYVTAVERAMRVLTAFDATHTHLSLSQLSDITGLDISAIQRFTYTLVALGYLRRDEETKKFEVTPRLLDFSHIYLSANDICAKATPYLQRLAHETEEVVNLSVLDGTDMVLVSRIVSRHAINPNIQVGSRMPAFCTASGLAWLSASSDAEVDAILSTSMLHPYTRNTQTKPADIKRRLQGIRKDGYVYTEEEYRLGSVSTAGPIRDAKGRVQAALSISVSTPRWNKAVDAKRYADLVLATCAAISSR